MMLQRLMFLGILCTTIGVQAVITPLHTLDRFTRKIINEPLVVAYIYQSEPNCIDIQGCYDKAYRKERKQQIAKNNTVLKAISRDGRYQAAGISFVTTNLSKNHVCDLKETYQLTDQDSVLLFDKEKVIQTDLTGILNRSDVEQIIESQWGTKIDTILKQQAEERKQRLAELKANYAYWGTGPYWGWPYGSGWGWDGYGGGYGGGSNGYFAMSFGFSC